MKGMSTQNDTGGSEYWTLNVKIVRAIGFGWSSKESQFKLIFPSGWKEQ